MTGLRQRLERQTVRILLVALPLLLFGAGCRAQAGAGMVVTHTLSVAGEDLEVTRVLAQPLPQPSPVASTSADAGTGVLDIALEGGPGIFDPQTARTPNELTLIENLFVGLTRYNHATNEVEPELATSWDVSPDGLKWTFYLRDDIFWIKPGLQATGGVMSEPPGPHVYRPVIADDVVYAIERACDSRTRTPEVHVLVLFIVEGCEQIHTETRSGATDPSPLGVRAPDAHTVEITLNRPAQYFETISSMWLLRPVPREIVEPLQGWDESWTAMENVVTSGPFVPGRGALAEGRFELQRNPFWPIPFTGSVDAVNILWRDATTAHQLWLDKEVDISPLAPGTREEIMNSSRWRPRLRLVTSQAAFYLAYNFDSPVFSEPAVRRAFGAAIDREALLEEVYATQGQPMRHFSPPGARGAPSLEEIGTGYSPDRARIEMAASSLADCAFLPEVRYMVGTTDLALHHAETIRSMWVRELGCPEEKIIIEQVEFGRLLASTRPDAGAERPDLWDLGWSSYFPDAHNWLGDVLHCRDGENRQNRPCSEVDDLISRAALSTTSEERNARYREAERLFFGEGGIEPLSPLFVRGRYVLVHPWLVYQPAHFGGEQFDTYYLDAMTKRLEREQ